MQSIFSEPNPLLAVTGNGSVTAPNLECSATVNSLLTERWPNPNQTTFHPCQCSKEFTVPIVQCCSASMSTVASRNKNILIVAGRSYNNLLSIEQFNFTSKQWTEIPASKLMHEGCGIIFLDNRLYLVSY